MYTKHVLIKNVLVPIKKHHKDDKEVNILGILVGVKVFRKEYEEQLLLELKMYTNSFLLKNGGKSHRGLRKTAVITLCVGEVGLEKFIKEIECFEKDTQKGGLNTLYNYCIEFNPFLSEKLSEENKETIEKIKKTILEQMRKK